jgi:hypothetical protein
MNILLWVLQVLLALWNAVGGVFTISHHEDLTSAWASGLPRPTWIAICVLQIAFALGLFLKKVTPVAAIYLTINSLAGCALFAKYAGFPGALWGVIPAILAALVAYGRR